MSDCVHSADIINVKKLKIREKTTRLVFVLWAWKGMIPVLHDLSGNEISGN